MQDPYAGASTMNFQFAPKKKLQTDCSMSLLARRRARTGAEEIETVEDCGVEVPDDAVVALQLLRTQFPPVPGISPVALVSQIYSLVKDRTSVDRQLDKAMRRQELRLFRFPAPYRKCPLRCRVSLSRCALAMRLCSAAL